MELLRYILRKAAYGIPLILGVTLISFVLMVEFGPDKTYDLIDKNATAEQIAEIRAQLGYDRPFIVRYMEYLQQMMRFDYGYSDSTGESVASILERTVPVTILMSLPGFLLGNLLGIGLALYAAYARGKWLDKAIMTFSVVGMSISFVIVLIVFQYLFCSSMGLNLFPVSGWDTSSFSAYVMHVTVPTLCSVFVALGYNTRFYRALFVEEMSCDHVRTARAFGAPMGSILIQNILRNSLIPIITRIIFTIPFIIIGGSLLIESYYGIPGIGQVTYDAISSGDQPILKAVVSMTAIMYVMVLMAVDILYRVVDPRISIT